MTGTAMAPNLATWSAPGHSFRIEYSAAVLEQIREIAVDGYHRVPHGGVETGGILFGTHQENVVRILAWRPIACEYAKGPSFLLSEKEEAALAEALKGWRGDAELARLEPVGWYRAHTRSEVLLADADLAFFNKFFPQPWQVGLIVRPASFAPTRAGFFFREADGSIHVQSSYFEFTVTPVAGVQAPPAAEVPEVPRTVMAAPEPPPVTATEPRPALESEPHAPLRGIGAQWKWYAASLIVLAIAALGFWLLTPFHPSLTLSATDMRGHLRIAWDGAARSIGHAKSGSIEIDDHGVRTQLNLTPADLRSGNLFYERQSADVAVRLTVDVPGSPPVVATTRFLRPAESRTAPRLEAAQQPEARPQTEASQARLELPPPRQPPAPAKSTRRAIPFQAPNQAPRQSSADMPSIAPPTLENLPVAPPAGLTSVLGTAPRMPAAPAPSRAAIAATAVSGRIIWTGRLAKNGRLVVERNHASSGAISGLLPAVAARVSAYPGDLTADGITLFTADPRYSQPLTEKAGAENGWNPTTYTWDPKRAGGIKVLEQPGPQNGYKLVLESDIPKLSVVMLEWRATQ
jgi:proteasome lid subunit RPN8/RPN11